MGADLAPQMSPHFFPSFLSRNQCRTHSSPARGNRPFERLMSPQSSIVTDFKEQSLTRENVPTKGKCCMKYSVRLKTLWSLAFVIAVVLWAGPRVMATLNPPAPVHLTALAGPFRNPIGIDFQDTSGGNLIATINYPTGGSAGD